MQLLKKISIGCEDDDDDDICDYEKEIWDYFGNNVVKAIHKYQLGGDESSGNSSAEAFETLLKEAVKDEAPKKAGINNCYTYNDLIFSLAGVNLP